MKYLFFAALFFTPLVRAEEKTIPEYLIHFSVLENMATDKLRVGDLLALRANYPHRADFIGKFWRQKALAANEVYIERLIRRASDRMAGAIDADKNKISEEMKDDIRFLFMGYYFDHADEITAMIAYSSKRAKSEDEK